MPEVFKLATSILSPGGARGRLSAFIFHRVLPAPDPLQPSEPHAEQFDAMLGWIGSQFNVLPPLEACERLTAKSLPPRAAIITFDDGYRDNHDIALPLLKKHGMTAVFFVATGYLDGGVMFNDRVIEAVRGCKGGCIDLRSAGLDLLPLGSDADRRSAIAAILARVKHLAPASRDAAVESVERAAGAVAKRDLMMIAAHVPALCDAGMEVGGHTHGHPILRSVDDATARTEIARGREVLAGLVGDAPALFAYPNGKIGDDFEARHIDLVKSAGFRYAFTTCPGTSTSADNAFLLKRGTPWARTRLRFQSQALRALIASDDRTPVEP